MATRRYSTEDRAACRYVLENRGADMKQAIDTTLTVPIAQRLALLRLLDGPQNGMYVGRECRLAGLGEKTAYEAVRLGVAVLTAAGAQQQQSAPNRLPAKPLTDAC